MRPSRSRALTLLTLVILSACGGQDRETRLNVRPPKPGIPQRSSDVTGIYRTTRPATLQLRQKGSVSLIVPVAGVGATSGTYTLQAGRFELRTKRCGDAVGRYTLEVKGRQVAGEAILAFTTVSDTCAERNRYLTIDPWYYADS